MVKASTGATKKSGSSHPTYKEMIKDAIINLKERNGSSRQALKKYIQNNHTINVVSQTAFDSQFNKAIKNGVEKEEFFQPKGPSGTVKLAKKEPAPKAAKPAAKPAAKKATTTKATTTKKAATAKKPAAKATTTTKKAAAPKKATTAKPKANTAKPRKAPASAPAVVEVPKVLGKTKSGRVTKSTTAAAPKKAPAKRAPSKRTSK